MYGLRPEAQHQSIQFIKTAFGDCAGKNPIIRVKGDEADTLVHVSISRSLPDLVEESPEVGIMGPSSVNAFDNGSESCAGRLFSGYYTLRLRNAGYASHSLAKGETSHSPPCLRKVSYAERVSSTGSVMHSELVLSITKARLITVDHSEKTGYAPAVPHLRFSTLVAPLNTATCDPLDNPPHILIWSLTVAYPMPVEGCGSCRKLGT